MSPQAARPPVTWRSLSVLVAVLVVLGLLVWVSGRLSGPVAEPPTTSATRPTSGPATSARASSSTKDPETGLRWADLDILPSQVASTVRLIQRGGPYPYARDGVTFRNAERILPRRASGYYREYTVPTPGSDDRGARRVVTGAGDTQFFYSGDHYNSFVRIRI